MLLQWCIPHHFSCSALLLPTPDRAHRKHLSPYSHMCDYLLLCLLLLMVPWYHSLSDSIICNICFYGNTTLLVYYFFHIIFNINEIHTFANNLFIMRNSIYSILVSKIPTNIKTTISFYIIYIFIIIVAYLLF